MWVYWVCNFANFSIELDWNKNNHNDRIDNASDSSLSGVIGSTHTKYFVAVSL